MIQILTLTHPQPNRESRRTIQYLVQIFGQIQYIGSRSNPPVKYRHPTTVKLHIFMIQLTPIYKFPTLHPFFYLQIGFPTHPYINRRSKWACLVLRRMIRKRMPGRRSRLMKAAQRSPTPVPPPSS